MGVSEVLSRTIIVVWAVGAALAVSTVGLLWPRSAVRRPGSVRAVDGARQSKAGPLLCSSRLAGPAGIPLVAALGAALGVVAGSPTLAVMPAPVAAFVLVVRRRAERRSELAGKTVALSAFIDAVGAELRSGASLHGAVIASMSEPQVAALDDEFRALRDAIGAGVTVDAALLALGRTTPTAELSLFATTAAVLMEHGGPVGPAIDRVGELIRSSQANDGVIRSQASQAMASASVMAALPVVFGSTLALIDPRLADFYLRSPIGTVCVVICFGLVVTGWLWMDHLVWRRR